MWKSVLRLLLFCLVVTLFFAGTTDADLLVNKTVPSNVWAATTLDFNNADTANNQTTNMLFNVNGLVPGGFQIKSLRVKNEGKMKFSYVISADNITGDPNLSGNLKVKAMKNWEVKYDGYLKDLKIQIDTKNNNDDWVLVLSMMSNDQNLAGKEIDFGILVKTINPDGQGGFYVEQRLDNRVMTGSWKN